jgi:hypothetical protein
MVGVTGAGAGLDSAWEQRELEARKMLVNRARREAAVPGVQCTLCLPSSPHSALLIDRTTSNRWLPYTLDISSL